MANSTNDKNKRLTLPQRVRLKMLWVGCCAFGKLPHFVQFRVVAPIISFIIYYIVRYRLKVVQENLRNSFPEKSDEERRLICRKFYTIFSEVIVSTVAIVNRDSRRNLFSDDESNNREEGSAQRMKEYIGSRSYVTMTAHFGLWEYFMYWSSFADQRLLALYHPLRNRVFNELLKRMRNYHKVLPIPAKEAARFVLRNGLVYRGENYMIGLIADQSPKRLPNSHWHKFLNQDTLFFDGGEKIAMRSKMPVLFSYQRRLAPGRYQMRYKLIWDGEESVEPNEITSRYVKMLEELIIKEPHMWLWSHRRWKHRRESTPQIDDLSSGVESNHNSANCG